MVASRSTLSDTDIVESTSAMIFERDIVVLNHSLILSKFLELATFASTLSIRVLKLDRSSAFQTTAHVTKSE